MDLDIFTPDYKKELKALEKAKEMLHKASATAASDAPAAVQQYLDAVKFIEGKKELIVQHRHSFSDCYIEIGSTLMRLGKKDDGFRSLESAVQIASEHAPAWAELGRAVLADGKFEEACSYLDRALVLDPSDAESWVAKGDAMRSLMEFGEARMSYVKALELDPLRIDSYDRLLEIGPEDAEVLKGKAVALSIKKQHNEAMECFKKALAKEPSNASVLAEMGRRWPASGTGKARSRRSTTP